MTSNTKISFEEQEFKQLYIELRNSKELGDEGTTSTHAFSTFSVYGFATGIASNWSLFICLTNLCINFMENTMWRSSSAWSKSLKASTPTFPLHESTSPTRASLLLSLNLLVQTCNSIPTQQNEVNFQASIRTLLTST